MSWDFSILQQVSPVAIVLVFLGGVITSIGPCNVVMIPLIVGYLGGSRELTRWQSFYLSTTFAVGLAVTFMALGLFASLAGSVVGAGQRWLYYLVAGVCLLIGIQMLGLIHLPIPDFLAARRERLQARGVLGAFTLGLVSGLVSSQCATPVLAAILTFVMAKGAIAYGAVLLFVYALGRGVPIIAAGTFTGALKRFMAFGRWSGVIEKAGGAIIIGVGVYLAWLA